MSDDIATVLARLRERDLLADVERVCRERRVLVADVLGGSREQSVSRARHAVWRDLTERYGMSTLEMGRLLGNNHVSIMRALGRKPRRPPMAVARLGSLRVI